LRLPQTVTPTGMAPVDPGLPRVAFFDYHDVFEDFYTHYGVTQEAFGTSWAGTACHEWVRLVEKQIGHVTWYSFSLNPRFDRVRHQATGCDVCLLRSPLAHRLLWWAFYASRFGYRLHHHFAIYQTVASYLSLASFRLVRELRTNRPDFIFVQDYATGRYDILVTLARILRIPLIALHTGSSPDRYVAPALKRKTIRAAARVIASSEGEQRMLIERFGVQPDRVSVIATPIDTETFSPFPGSAEPLQLPASVTGRVLLFVGRIDRIVKRVDVLIEAFGAVAKRHHDVDLVIIGDGLDRNAMEVLAAQTAPGRIHFLGWIEDRSQLAAFYNRAELLLLPSRREGLPTVVAESLACGTPVLASDLPGVRAFIVEGETGWTLPAGDAQTLAAKLDEILIGELAPRLRERCRAIALELVSTPRVAAALREFWPPPIKT
jgi:glycosyltransferase involved in cell wall biosynthesis